MIIVELGLELEKSLGYYERKLKNNGLKRVYKCKTHDIYFTNNNLDGLTENEMKCACIRLRSVNKNDYEVQNNLGVIDDKIISRRRLSDFEKRMLTQGYVKAFDTKKKDYHYHIEGMKSRIQLQEIKGIGLLVYYDNPDYYELSVEEQKQKLIEELNSYGFNFEDDTLGLDKLRTLYYKEKKYSDNQNG